MRSHLPSSTRGLWQFILLLNAFTLLTSFAHAFNITLEWNANQESDIAGYKVYVGSHSANYETFIDAGFATRQFIESLEFGRQYYFAVTAYDSNGMESAFSDEITYTVPVDGTNACLVPLRMTLTPSSPVAITFAGESARSYFVQASVDLVSWQTVVATMPSSNGTNQWLDVEAANFPKRFYRVVRSLP